MAGATHAMADATASRPGPDDDPIEGVIAELIARLKPIADQPEPKLTCDELLRLVGAHSHVLALLIFSLLNLLPAPPGYNFFMALIITAVSFAMLAGRDVRLAGFFGRMKLPVKLVMKLLGVLSTLAGWAARVSAPRLFAFTGAAMRPAVAVTGVVLGVAMMVPIPFTNMVPSIGLAVVCVGVLNSDGLLVLGGAVLGAIGVALLIAAIWLIFAIGFAVEDAVDGEGAPAAAPAANA